MDPYFETDERTEVIEALEMAVEQLARVEDHPYRWKWVIVSLHNALQALMVVALAGSTGAGALEEKSAEKWLAFLENPETSKDPEQWLAKFMELFKRIQGEQWRSQPFEPTEEVRGSVTTLNAYRNAFIHFVPAAWLISTDRMVTVLLGTLEVVRFLLQSDAVWWYEPEQEARSEEAVSMLLRQAERLQAA